MNPEIISVVALVVAVAAFVSGVVVSARVINIANEVKAKVEAVVKAAEDKAKSIEKAIK